MRVRERLPEAVREVENLWIPMADGTRLAARLWLPETAERQPVPAIVEMIPYRKRDGTAWRDGVMQPYVAGHGYAVLRVDLRGTGESDGLMTDEYTRAEHADGEAVLAWAARQPWSTGKCGMIGLSYGGFNALQIAARRPPALSAIVTIGSSDDRYADDAHYMGGAVLTEHAIWGVAILAQTALPPDPLLVGARWREMWLNRLEHMPDWVGTWLTHQRRDEYWRYGSVAEDYAAIACPVYAIGGWNDAYRNTVGRLLTHLSVPRKGLIGPWAHGWPLTGAPGPAMGFLQEVLRWWDHWLKGRDTGIMAEPVLRVWMPASLQHTAGREIQPGRWVAEECWPSPRIAERSFQLNPGHLSPHAHPEKPLHHSSPQFTGRASGAWCPYASGTDLDGDQAPDDGGSLIFDSAPLEEDLAILGAPEVELELSVDRAVGLIIARLCDVNLRGQSSRVTYGVLNLTHRQSHAGPQALVPGERFRVRLQLNDIAHAFPAGHRLRLALSTSYWPTVWPAPEPVAVTLYSGVSRLILPERPERAADAELLPFGEPEGAPEPAMSVIAEGSGSASWRYDLAEDRAELVIERKGGLDRFDAIDMTTGTDITQRFTIAASDPLSARAELGWTMTRRRGDWQIRIEAAIAMASTQRHFHLRQHLVAYEGEREIFARDWEREIERDLV